MASLKASIIIPVYNGSNFLKEAIDSALGQTYGNMEVLVINDGSNDNGATEKIALSYGSRIRYFSKENGGVSSALNLGIEKMTGDFFSWLSHDDVYKPEKIEKQISFHQSSNQSDAVVYGDYEIINDRSKIIDEIILTRQYSTEQLNKSLFPVFRGLINGCTLLIPKTHFDRVGNFNEALRTTQDYELWFRILRQSDVLYCPGSYVQSRVHASQASKVKAHIEECDELWIQLLNEISVEEMGELEETPFNFFYNTSVYLRKHSFYSRAEKYAMERAMQYSETKMKRKKLHIPKMQGSKKYLLRRLLNNLRTEGIVSTIQKVIRKF